MVNLTRIYTRTGDQGTTALGDMSRTAKTDPRIAAYADANEANAVIGTAIALGRPGDGGRARSSSASRTTCSTWARTCRPRSSRTRSTRRCGSSSSTSTGWRRTATASTGAGEAALASSCRAVRRAPPCSTRRARSYGARNARRGRAGDARRHDEPPHRHVSQPPLRPPVHPGAYGQQGGRGRCCGCRAASADPGLALCRPLRRPGTRAPPGPVGAPPAAPSSGRACRNPR